MSQLVTTSTSSTTLPTDSAQHTTSILSDQSLSCGLCKGALEEARVFPCLHSFCLHCLKSKFPARKTNIDCPKCHAKVSLLNHETLADLPTNSMYSNLTGILETKMSLNVNENGNSNANLGLMQPPPDMRRLRQPTMAQRSVTLFFLINYF